MAQQELTEADRELAAGIAGAVPLEGEKSSLVHSTSAPLMAESLASSVKSPRSAILGALIEVSHQVTADEVRFFRDPSKDTTALAQLCDSLEAAWPSGVKEAANG